MLLTGLMLLTSLGISPVIMGILAIVVGILALCAS